MHAGLWPMDTPVGLLGPCPNTVRVCVFCLCLLSQTDRLQWTVNAMLRWWHACVLAMPDEHTQGQQTDLTWKIRNNTDLVLSGGLL